LACATASASRFLQAGHSEACARRVSMRIVWLTPWITVCKSRVRGSSSSSFRKMLVYEAPSRLALASAMSLSMSSVPSSLRYAANSSAGLAAEGAFT